MIRLTLALCLAALPAAADSFDDLRARWRTVLTGGDAVDTALPQVRSRLSGIESSARGNWNSLQKASDRKTLWTDLASTTSSAQITSSWSRLAAMALAWATPGQTLYGDAVLLTDLRSAMSWMEQNRYHAAVRAEYDNWWDWEIGTPLHLGNILTLLYEQLPPEELQRYTAALDRFVADPRIMIVSTVSTGANRVWKCKGSVLRALAAKDAARLQQASDALSPVYAYVNASDGFYEDGSFIQHGRHPYTGGYGNALIGELADLMYLLAGSPWEVRDPAAANVYRWVFESFQPVIYRGAMMDMLRGREISRSGSPDHAVGHSSAAGILRVAQFAPEEQAQAMRAMLKQWYRSDTSRDWSTGRSLDQVMAIRRLLEDESVTPREELTGSWMFAGMDRSVHLRPGWGFGIAMHSSRVYNYESINNENLRAWHTGDGMTYLYTADLTQFSDSFWPTVDPQRLPGTTVIAGSTARQSQAGGSAIAGGATLDGYSTVMFQLRPDGRQLDAKKSWFLLDDKVVAVGSDIRSTAGERTVETIVENRLVRADAVFTAASDETWAHLEGVAGYLFPAGGGWKSARGDRQGSWSLINIGGSTATVTRRYQTVWFDHGPTPGAASYAYAILPGRSREETEAAAGAPGFRIVEQSAMAHALEAEGLKAVNFYQAGTAAGVTSDAVAVVLMHEADGAIRVAIADPTQTGGTLHVELDRAAGAVGQKDDSVTVTQTSPTVRVSIDLRNARGRTHRVAFTRPD
jgi:hyaluronate lyase